MGTGTASPDICDYHGESKHAERQRSVGEGGRGHRHTETLQQQLDQRRRSEDLQQGASHF
jgi:hypothetical protein